MKNIKPEFKKPEPSEKDKKVSKYIEDSLKYIDGQEESIINLCKALWLTTNLYIKQEVKLIGRYDPEYLEEIRRIIMNHCPSFFKDDHDKEILKGLK